ncbi:MAG: ACP S-malonyltransferase [Proteobacteria bacterium]|nr:ACP S-malonyltransferase [Pseudomonadota bacterium]
MVDNAKLAIVFPGQGSQSIGMMNELVKIEPDIKATFDIASDVLGYNLWAIVVDGPESELNKTEVTQPALLASAVATWKVWQQRASVIPALLAGHSLGEYSALVCADVISFEDGIRLVAERGRCMQEAVPAGVGAMAAILGLDDEQVNKVCQEVNGSEIVSAANFNSPGQVVIAGHKNPVERATEEAKKAGAKRAILLPVSVPSHCMLMREAADRFAETLNNVVFKDAGIPIIQNVDAQARTDAAEIRPLLLEQLYKPVQWVNTIKTMKALEIEKIIECGPGKVLAGLVKRIDRSFNIHFIQDESSLNNALA